jgi:hypothetical protein
VAGVSVEATGELWPEVRIMGCLVYRLVYVIAGIALWRMWTSCYAALWWSLLIAVILYFWTAETVRTAYRQCLAEASPQDECEKVLAEQLARDNDVVRLWVGVNFVLCVVTAVLAIIGLALSLAGS